MDFDQLKAFLSIAQTRNFTKSSLQLHIAQSTITSRIQTLEESVEQKLFHRTNRTVELTPAGEVFLPYAERMLTLAEESKLGMKVNTQNKERLVVAGNSSIWTYLLHPLVRSFRERHPNVLLHVISGHSSKEVIQYLIDGVVDIAVVFNPPHESKIDVIHLFEEELVLVGNSSFRKNLTKRDFFGSQYIHIDWGPNFLEWFEESVGPSFIPSMRINQSTYMMRLLLEGDGFGFMIRSIVEPYIRNEELFLLDAPFAAPPPTRKVSAIYLKSKRAHLKTPLGFDLLNIDQR